MAAGATTIYFLVVFGLFEFTKLASVWKNKVGSRYKYVILNMCSSFVYFRSWVFYPSPSSWPPINSWSSWHDRMCRTAWLWIAAPIWTSKEALPSKFDLNQNSKWSHTNQITTLLIPLIIFPLQARQRSDHPYICNTSSVPAVQLVLVAVVVGTIPGHLDAVGIRDSTMDESQRRTNRWTRRKEAKEIGT